MEDLGQHHILVTGGGAPGAAGIIKALRAKDWKISSCDIRTGVVGEVLADHFFTVPSGNQPGYIDALIKECKDHQIDVVFPITTKELFPISKNLKLLEQNGIKAIITSYDTLVIANDKGKIYDHLKKHGISTPHYSVVKEFNSFKQFLDNNQDTKMTFKPCISNGSRGFRIIDDGIDKHDLLFNHKPNNTFISRNAAEEILSSKPFPALLMAEYLPGDEYSVDCLVNNGNTLLVIPRLRTKLNNGISVEGQIVNDSKVINYVKSILRTLNLNGPIGVQVKLDTNNNPQLLEINPRIQGTSVACIGAGVNIPLLSVLQSLGIDIQTIIEHTDIKWGTRFVRYYDEEYLK